MKELTALTCVSVAIAFVVTSAGCGPKDVKPTAEIDASASASSVDGNRTASRDESSAMPEEYPISDPILSGLTRALGKPASQLDSVLGEPYQIAKAGVASKNHHIYEWHFPRDEHGRQSPYRLGMTHAIKVAVHADSGLIDGVAAVLGVSELNLRDLLASVCDDPLGLSCEIYFLDNGSARHMIKATYDQDNKKVFAMANWLGGGLPIEYDTKVDFATASKTKWATRSEDFSLAKANVYYFYVGPSSEPFQIGESFPSWVVKRPGLLIPPPGERILVDE